MNVNKGNIKDGNIYRRFMSVVLLTVITLISVFIGFGSNATVEAKTVLNRVSDGLVHTTYNVNLPVTYKYGYLLYDGSKGGYLPDIKNLSKYGYSNLGWDIDTPTRSYFSDGSKGREFSHTVFPSKTKFVTKDGREYLRITGTAVAPQYFHMTEDNHRVAILTRENGNNGTIKLWEATLLDQTSSASFDYGFGYVYGVSDTRAYYNTVLKNGGSATKLTVRVSNDPYPASVRKAWGTKHANYYDAAYAPRFNSRGLHTDQVANLSGLGVVGHDLYNDYTTSEEGTTYILEYTGFVVDIPLDALITNKSKNKSTYDFRILMTQTTPSDNVGGQKVDARVYGQSLQVPGFSGKSATTFDTQYGYTGKVDFKPADIGKIEFTPDYDTMRALKHTSNFSLSHDYDGVDTSDSFSASKASPRFMGTLYKFGTGTWDEIRKDKNPEYVEDFSNGRGSMWIGWNMNSFSNNRRVYTTVSNAYTTMPPAKMTYTRNDTQEKPVIVRHRLIGTKDTKFTNPGEIFKTDIARVKSGGSYTVKPLTQTQLNGFSSTLRYTGSARIPADATKPATKLSTTGTTYTSTQLSSSTLGGKEALYVDVYYTGTLPSDTVGDTELVYNIYHREKGTNKSLATTTSATLSVGESVQVSSIKPEGYKYTGNFTVDGASKTGSTYRISHTSPTSKKVNIVFYYEKADMDYTVEYLEKGTNKTVAPSTTGKVKYGNSYVAKPKSIYGYKPSGQYSANGSMKTGSSYTIKYDEDTAKFKLVFYYEKADMDYTVEYREKDTNKTLAPSTSGEFIYGNSYVAAPKTIRGYKPNGQYSANGKMGSGSSYTIKYDEDIAEFKVVFYYEKRQMNYTVEYRNINTNDKIATNDGGKMTVGQSVVTKYKNISGYTPSNQFAVNNGSKQSGTTYTIKYSDVTGITITYYYNRNESYTVEYREKGTNKTLAPSTTGEVIYGKSYVAKPKSIYGYKPSGQYSANGSMGSGSSYTIKYDADIANFKLVFYYEKREMNYTIEYRNIDTNNKIATNDGGKMTVGQSVVTKYKNIAGYTPSNRFAVNNGSKQSGTTYTIKYSDATGITVTYYYKWNEPALTTKRMEKDTGAVAIPMDLYANMGIVTKRDSAGNVIGTTLDTNTSAILNPSGAPLGIALDTITVTYKDASGKVLYETTKNTDGFITNNEFLNNYNIDSRIGSSSVASGMSSVALKSAKPTTVAGSTYQMSNSVFKSSEAVEKAGLGLSNAKIGSELDDYLGRWVSTDNATNQKVNNLNQWTPSGTLAFGASYTGGINKVDKVDVSYKVKTFNRMKHNYTPKVGGDGLEYYEYSNSEFLSGNYRFDASGKRVSDTVYSADSTTLRFTLNASSLKTDKYIDADGFKAGSGKVNTVQTPVALEELQTFGVTPSGYKLETVGATGAPSVMVAKVASKYSEKSVTSLKSITSYEEFGYAPYHKDDSLLTQQAVPVGGVYSYVNPYNSSLLPTVGGVSNSVMMKSGYTLSEIVANAKNIKKGVVNDTDIDYNKNNGTGFYSSEKDNFSSYALGTVSTTDKTTMNSALTSANKIGTRMTSPVGATYNSTKTPFSASLLKYKQGFTVDTTANEFRLDGRVAVGADTGFPIYKSASSTGGLKGSYDYGKAYKDAYKAEFGVEPSGTDKPMTTYDGSLYLVPLERTTNTLSSSYYTRLYVDGIGVSQMNFMDDNTLKAENYLYGRGNNTIYSGERKQVQYDGKFTEDQTIGQKATPSDTTHTNGVRTNNNSVLNKEVITDFKNSSK